MRIAVISLEVWDDVWRRNQHFAHQLVRQGVADELVFLEPADTHERRSRVREVGDGITAVRPAALAPKRLGGLALLGASLRRRLLRDVDVLWINDPTLGVHCLAGDVPALYDVTDDWRTFGPARIRRRVMRAEDRLAKRAGTVVCSQVLQDRWHSRYGLRPAVIHNGVDAELWRHASPRALEGSGPHVGYVGTLHDERLDVDLLLRCADSLVEGTVHLVGPDALSTSARSRLQAHPRIVLHGAVSASEVPSWCKAMSVLICPHLVSPFTLSLDAIKSYEYLASARPVLATPTSGFQELESVQLTVAGERSFVAELQRLLGSRVPPTYAQDLESWDWAWRARDFAAALAAVASAPRRGTRPR